MADATPRYKHSPLKDRSCIRLLTLLPGHIGSPLKCKIAEFDGPPAGSYEALSYTWGDASTSETIGVCESNDTERIERSFLITPNLFQALQRLRTDIPRLLWIDALCMNQGDLEEKGHQVARMGQVYRNASSVIVWLGEDERYPRTRALLEQDGKNRWPLTIPEVDLGELVTIPWFSRVWAVQEYALPRKVLFQLGPLSISSQHVETVITRTGTYLDGDKKLQDQWKSILLLFEVRKLVQQRKPDDKTPRLTLVRTFLDLTRSRLCKDSRDRIYGILGLFDNTNIAPDYTLPPRQVYQDFVSKHLVAGDFAILHECCIGIPNVDEQSYVPFFGQSRSQTKYLPFADPLGATYCAGSHLAPSVNISDEKHISLEGFSIDTVQQKLDFVDDGDIGFNANSQELAANSEKPSPESATLPLRGNWGAIYQAIMNHLITDPIDRTRWRKDYEENRISPQFSKPPYPYNSLFDVLVRTIRTDLNADFDWLSSKGTIRTDAHLHRTRREILAERSLFWTGEGYIGLGTCHMQPGDEVVVFNGDTTPFLLRREPSAEEKGAYKIVSDCYLFGWMYGQYPDQTVAKDPSRRKSFINKLKGGEKQERKSVGTQTFVIK